MQSKRIAAILLAVAAVMALTAYAYIWEPKRISGGVADVVENDETEPVITNAEPVVTDAPETEADTVETKEPEVPDYLSGEYVSKGGIRITLNSNRRGTWRDADGETEVFWMYDSAEKKVSVFNYEGDSFVGNYNEGVLTGLLNYSDEIEFYDVSIAPPSLVELPDPPNNPTVFQTIDTFFHGGFGFTVYGAEFIRDADGFEAVRVWFDFSNYSKETVIPSEIMELRMYSGDTTVLERCKNSDAPEAGGFDNSVDDGVSVRVAADFRVNWSDTAKLTFQIRHEEYNAAEAAGELETLTDGLYIITAEFDPASLPALPAGGVLPPLVQY